MISNILWRRPPDRYFLYRIRSRSMTNASPAAADRYIRQCYAILEIDPNCRDETMIRKAYLEKVKQYHPDSTFQDNRADQTKFHQVQQAYETLTETLKVQGSIEETTISSNENDEEIRTKFDIRHTAPQHRTHLEYGGFGIGTPSQRQTAFYKMRAEKAFARVYEYRNDRESVETQQELIERKKRKDIKSTNFIDRLVEDLIQESMSKGDFNNIRPSGKPLHERNPHYMDFTTYKMNEILIDNGYMPDWILLEKDIRQSIDQARMDLKRVYKTIASETSATNDEKTFLVNNSKWIDAIDKFQNEIAAVNVNINKLNLIVPMLWRQQVHYNAEKEISKIVALDPLTIELPPSQEELAAINHQEQNQRHAEWEAYQSSQRFSFADALRDFVQAFKNFRV